MNREILRCRECDLIFVKEGLAYESPGVSIYETRENSLFFRDGNECYYLDESSYRAARAKAEWVTHFLVRGAHILDVGSGFGDFLKACEGTFVASGFDVSPVAVEWSRTHRGVDNRVGSIYTPPEELTGPYDAITLWDVVEHIPDPEKGLRVIRERLRPAAWLFLSTPDAGSLSARLLGKRWHYIDPVQHLLLFNRRNLKDMLSHVGFRTVESISLSRSYRLRYVCDRLSYLNSGRPVQSLIRLGRAMLYPFLEMSVLLQLGDVMGVAAQRFD